MLSSNKSRKVKYNGGLLQGQLRVISLEELSEMEEERKQMVKGNRTSLRDNVPQETWCYYAHCSPQLTEEKNLCYGELDLLMPNLENLNV